MKVVIVGGVAGGASTAARLRRRDEQAEIVLFEKGSHISYANCGLPYYIGEVIRDRDSLFVQTPEQFSRRFRVDVRTGSEVIRIHRKDRCVEVRDHRSGKVYREPYDRLVLSPGAEPVRPPLPGIDLPGIFTMRNVPDTDRIKEFVDRRRPRRAVIVGAGFIGLEVAENLRNRGVFVTIVEMADQVMTPLDFEMAGAVHHHLKMHDVEFYLKGRVKAFRGSGKSLTVEMEGGRVLSTDMVILSVGVRPDSRLALDAGLETGETGGIRVRETLQTSDPDIYAVGDAVEFRNPIIGKQRIFYLAGPSNKQGRICADNMVDGNRHTYPGTLGTAIARVFDLTVASTGLSEKSLKKEGIPYLASITHGASHAGYYPGAMPLTLKIVFEPETGRLYGAQGVGYEGVDKRIDLIATVIRNRGTVRDLTEIEHAYAPPYSSAKDPVNIAGFVGENILDGLVKIVHWYDVEARDPEKDFLLDVRTAAEHRTRTIPGSVHIPLDDLRDRLNEIPRDRRIIVYCAAGLRAYLAARILDQHGLDSVYNLSGGFQTWEHATGEQANEDIYDELFIAKDDMLYSTDPSGGGEES